jgi:dihydropteroate synthase
MSTVREPSPKSLAAARPAVIPDLILADRVLPTSRRTLVQAVLNVTPDSFSDGGRFLTSGHPADAIAAGKALLDAGADIIDVGGESSRPGAQPVSVDEELRRVVPVVAALAEAGATVSIDTVKATVARAAVEAGAVIVNDISAGELDDELLPTVAELDAGYVLMHMQGTPRTMQHSPSYGDVVAEVVEFLATGLERLETLGLRPQRVAIDPGIGFGKTVAHNLELLRRLAELTRLGRPVLVGASRKSFLGHLTGQHEAADRVEASLAAATIAVLHGASIVRVHDVAATRHVVAVADAVTRGDPAAT